MHRLPSLFAYLVHCPLQEQENVLLTCIARAPVLKAELLKQADDERQERQACQEEMD